MDGPKYEDYRGFESSEVGSIDEIRRDILARSLKEGLDSGSMDYHSFTALSGILHGVAASWFWVRDPDGRLIRVRVSAEEVNG